MSATTLFEQSPTVPNREDLIAEWQEQGYANLPFSLGKTACQELFSNFKSFAELCSEPGGERLQKAVYYSLNGLGNDVYYFTHRKPGTVNPNEPDRPPGTDHKIKMHYGPQTIARATYALGGSLPAEMAEFLDNCDEVYDASRSTLQLGTGILGLEKVFLTPNRDEDVNHLCLLDYQPSEEEGLAEPHFDRGVFTLALSESSSGLRGSAAKWPETESELEKLRSRLSPIEHQEYAAKLFAGAGLKYLPAHLRQRAPVPFLAHDVLNERPTESRQSAVLFCNPHQLFTGYKSVPQGHETGFGEILEHLRKTA